jgi:hypothetical protein
MATMQLVGPIKPQGLMNEVMTAAFVAPHSSCSIARSALLRVVGKASKSGRNLLLKRMR